MSSFSTCSVLIVLFFALSSNAENIITLGNRESGNLMETRHVSSNGGYGSIDSTIIIPGNGVSIIKKLVIIDKSESRCASAVPINGGPGSNFVVMTFKAAATCKDGVDYKIEIYE